MRRCLQIMLAVLLTAAYAHAEPCASTDILVTSYGATPDGGGGDRAAFMSAQTAAVSGQTICAPCGTYDIDTANGVLFQKSGITWRGEGPCTILTRSLNTAVFQSNASFVGLTDLAVKDMTITSTCTPQSSCNVAHGISWNTGSLVNGATISGVVFDSIPAFDISAIGINNLTVDSCKFQHLPTGIGTIGVNLSANPSISNITIRRSTFTYPRSGIVIAAPTPDTATNILIEDNFFDLGWYLLTTLYSNSANTAGTTYTLNDVTDTNASFTTLNGLTASCATNGTCGQTDVIHEIRVLPVAGTGTVTRMPPSRVKNNPRDRRDLSQSVLYDPSANFVSAGILPGELVRTASAYGVVSEVLSATKLRVEQWRDRTTYKVIEAPASGTAYTAYHVYIGQLRFLGTTTGNDAGAPDPDNTTLNVDAWYGWFDLLGSRVDPPDGTLYELTAGRANYASHAEVGTTDITVRNNYYQRGFSDQISMYGKNATISGNKITRGEDMGITLHGKNNLVENNVISWQGAGGIWTTAQDTTVTTTIQNNTITKADWVNDNSTNFGAIMLFNAKGVLLLNNTMSTPALAPYGVAIRGDSGFTSDTITVTGNSALGFSTAGYGTIDTAGGTVTGITWGGGNAGTCAGNDCSGFQ